MARLTMAQAYAYARQAGFDPAAATIAAAIAMGESGLITDRRGDVNLQTPYWGPSVGLMQIRTVKSQTGTGGDRDISRLMDPLQNMISAYRISSGGKDWSPWTVYNTGKYREFLGQAKAGAAEGGGSGAIGQAQNVGLIGGLSTDAIASRVKTTVLTLVLVGGGAALAILGGYRAIGSPDLPKIPGVPG